MKRLLFTLLMALFLFTACEGPMGPPGEDGTETYWKIIEYTVKPQHWELVGEGSNPSEDELGTFYMHKFDLPELTNIIVNEGIVLVSFYIKGYNTWTTLPYSVPMYDNTGSNLVLYEQTYWFDYQVGSMAFYIDISDFFTGENWPNEDLTFKITMLW